MGLTFSLWHIFKMSYSSVPQGPLAIFARLRRMFGRGVVSDSSIRKMQSLSHRSHGMSTNACMSVFTQEQISLSFHLAEQGHCWQGGLNCISVTNRYGWIITQSCLPSSAECPAGPTLPSIRIETFSVGRTSLPHTATQKGLSVDVCGLKQVP